MEPKDPFSDVLFDSRLFSSILLLLLVLVEELHKGQPQGQSHTKQSFQHRDVNHFASDVHYEDKDRSIGSSWVSLMRLRCLELKKLMFLYDINNVFVYVDDYGLIWT
ncbi:hypothetical protein ACFX13_018839 [Malus domestica]